MFKYIFTVFLSVELMDGWMGGWMDGLFVEIVIRDSIVHVYSIHMNDGDIG